MKHEDGEGYRKDFEKESLLTGNTLPLDEKYEKSSGADFYGDRDYADPDAVELFEWLIELEESFAYSLLFFKNMVLEFSCNNNIHNQLSKTVSTKKFCQNNSVTNSHRIKERNDDSIRNTEEIIKNFTEFIKQSAQYHRCLYAYNGGHPLYTIHRLIRLPEIARITEIEDIIEQIDSSEAEHVYIPEDAALRFMIEGSISGLFRLFISKPLKNSGLTKNSPSPPRFNKTAKKWYPAEPIYEELVEEYEHGTAIAISPDKGNIRLFKEWYKRFAAIHKRTMDEISRMLLHLHKEMESPTSEVKVLLSQTSATAPVYTTDEDSISRESELKVMLSQIEVFKIEVFNKEFSKNGKGSSIKLKSASSIAPEESARFDVISAITLLKQHLNKFLLLWFNKYKEFARNPMITEFVYYLDAYQNATEAFYTLLNRYSLHPTSKIPDSESDKVIECKEKECNEKETSSNIESDSRSETKTDYEKDKGTEEGAQEIRTLLSRASFLLNVCAPPYLNDELLEFFEPEKSWFYY
ncbi:MAG: hypothetical protein QW728_04175 [Thermoplasmata archaeon]